MVGGCEKAGWVKMLVTISQITYLFQPLRINTSKENPLNALNVGRSVVIASNLNVRDRERTIHVL